MANLNLKIAISHSILLLFIHFQSFAQDRFELLDSVISNYQESDLFNGTILIAQGGEIVFNRNIGYADFENQIKLDINTPMHLASISKVFTNVAIIMLNEKGLLQFEDNVKNYIEDFPYDEVTVHHLMTSSSGLKRLYNQDNNKDGVISNQELLDYLSKKKPKLAFTPGDKHLSSVAGYCVLAEVIEQIVGKSYPAFIEEEIFLPLEMNDTFIYTKGSDRPRAVSYDKNNKEKEWYLGSFIGGVGIYTSANDLVKWDQVLYTNKVISQESIAKSYEKMKFNDGTLSHITLGGWMRWKGQENLIFKNGDWVANNAILFRDIEHNTTIIIMNNRQNSVSKFDLMDIILPELGYEL